MWAIVCGGGVSFDGPPPEGIGRTRKSHELGCSYGEVRLARAGVGEWEPLLSGSMNTAEDFYQRGMQDLEAGDVSDAESWFRKAADLGHATSMDVVGAFCADQGDFGGARSWWLKAADLGYSGAMWNLGTLAQEQGDIAGAGSWWRKAADLGNADAMSDLGRTNYEQGDVAGARSWWSKAAELGNSTAMTGLGVVCQEQG